MLVKKEAGLAARHCHCKIQYSGPTRRDAQPVLSRVTQRMACTESCIDAHDLAIRSEEGLCMAPRNVSTIVRRQTT